MSAVPALQPLSTQALPVPALRLTDISFSRNGESIVHDVNLTVAPGDFLALLGPNGGGKTTLLRLILGLLRPDSGEARLFGLPPDEARAQTGYVPQFSTIRQDFPATVLEMTLMGAANGSGGGFLGSRRLWPQDHAAREKARGLLDLIGIADLAARPVAALSGGQRQRMMVARALMGRGNNQPFLLLLDEPTANIDPQGTWCFFEFLASLKGAITIIVVSHEIGMASPFFSRVALVNKTLTLLPEGCPDADLTRGFIGAHTPECPMGQLLRHQPGCRCDHADQPDKGGA